MTVLLFAGLSYILGSIPTSYMVGRLRGLDLREHGSGNLGATNTYRVMGAIPAIVVLTVDVTKGLLPALFFPTWDARGLPSLALLYGMMAVIGHVWSIFLAFSGGKGVATAGGVLIALAPFTTVVAVLVWLGALLVTGIVSVASLVAVTTVPLVAFITDAPASTVVFCVLSALFVWWTHRTNLARLTRGEEPRLRRRRERHVNHSERNNQP